ncbi:cupin domain-containing protein [Stieleria sp. JC731]|uniref:cupin domain-containing protein n=1 Tax=Pirellulaceae TaxID=2691357 RepID=UPI001E329B46|nr:cupin domain-containing protein [Stieleria sp. JC731]MCC9603309.1 cupin domain-containing protein [Stieleria sp. JC731]
MHFKFVIAIAIVTLCASAAQADHAHDLASKIKVLQSVDIETEGPTAMKSTTLTVDFNPLDSHPPHRHPGAVFGYVIEGSIEFAISDEPVRTLKKGDSFFEPKMVLHRVARNPDKNASAKIVVVMLHPADAKQLVIPEPHAKEMDRKHDAK